jgi:hypothetical protein
MTSTDIYEVNKSPEEMKKDAPPKSSRRRRKVESFDQAVEKNISKTHNRRRKNSGLRRFRHLMKKPDFNKKFLTITLSVGGAILALLVIWDFFFRYPNNVADDQTETTVDAPKVQPEKPDGGWLE